MAEELWAYASLVAAAGGTAEGHPRAPVTGFAIDTRELRQGEVFVALKDQRDGHDFVTAAFEAGASAALVKEGYQKQPGDGALIRVADPLSALECIALAARARLASHARVIAVTGSAGKTGTKDMLRACLARLGPVHASEKSFNNHWGVPLTLARMPAATRNAVFEIGMNHAGEIRPLAKLVRPNAAIITTVEAVHLEHFPSVEAIADAKAEIFEGLVPGGAAIIKHDSPHRARLSAAAHALGAQVVTFGLSPQADAAAESLDSGDDGNTIVVRMGNERWTYRLAMPGRHVAENSVAVVAALACVGADVATALAALADLPPSSGRGARTPLAVAGGEVLLIDESYNANPASMRAALATLAAVPRTRYPRRIAVLGDMLELGPAAPKLHRDLKDDVEQAGVDLIFACGPHMKGLYDALRPAIKGRYCETAAALGPALMDALGAGDVVMVKGSNGIKLGAIVTSLKTRFANDGSSPVAESGRKIKGTAPDAL